MRAGEPDGETVLVELLEVDDADVGHPAAPAPGSPRPGAGPAGVDAADAAGERRRRRVATAVGAGVVVALAGVGVTVTALDTRREQARWDALVAAGVPVVDLTEPLEQVWVADGAFVLSEIVGGIVVQGAGPISEYRAIDLATGATLWELTARPDEWCQPWDPSWESLLTAARTAQVSPADVARPSVLVCASVPTSEVAEDPPDARSGVRVVDAATGEVTASVEVDGRIIAADPVRDGLIVTRSVPSGDVVLGRLTFPGAEPAWEVVVGPRVGDGDPWLWTQVVDGVVHLRASDGAVLRAVDADTGEDTAPVADVDEVVGDWRRLPDGTQVEFQYTAVPRGVVRDGDGTERFTFEGDLWTPLAGDGSMPDRIVVHRPGLRGGVLVALDLASGEELWETALEAPYTYGGGAIQVDGVLVGGAPTVAGYDLRSGERLWALDLDDQLGVGLLTDGTRIALPVREDGRPYLVAVGLHTGAEQWRIPLEGGSYYWQTLHDGTVLAQRENGLAAYR